MIIVGVVIGMVSCAAQEAPEPVVKEVVKEVIKEVVVAPEPPVSDGSADLTIDYQVNLAGADDNHFTWKTNVRYMAAEDMYDAATGASAAGSTHLFMMALYDIEGKATMSSGLRGLLLFGSNPGSQTLGDNLNASKGADGSITIQYVHRGTAYKFITDSKGVLSLPETTSVTRKIGTPKEIESAFTTDGKATGVDFATVWASDVVAAGADPASMYYWSGDLQVTLEGDILKIAGVLTAVPRR